MVNEAGKKEWAVDNLRVNRVEVFFADGLGKCREQFGLNEEMGNCSRHPCPPLRHFRRQMQPLLQRF